MDKAWLLAMNIGDDVYVENPTRFAPGCTSITGSIVATRQQEGQTLCEIDAYVAAVGGGGPARLEFAAADLGHRGGTPISQLSGRPGHPGYGRYCAIAASWGYD